MASGIYQIRNIINNKVYIGSAISFLRRFSIHKSNLKSNKHHSQYLQNAWNKYGEDSFKFEILFTCSISELIRLEQYHINNYNPEYNICRIAGNRTGVKASEETKQKMSISLKGRKHSDDHKHKISKGVSKSVIKMDMNNSIIKIYPSATIAQEEVLVNRRAIVECLNGRNKTAGGFKWRYNYD